MSLRRVQVSDFRCLQSADIEVDSELTLLSGPNASGKTSVLEAIYVLGRGRSFRTRQLQTLIRSGSTHFVVYGEVALPERIMKLGVEGSIEGTRAKIGGDRVRSLAALAGILPVQIIDPEIHRLIEEGPGYRRRFLDWGVFHVEHGFVEEWQQYQYILRQRNAALRLRQSRPVISAWDPDLLRLGTRLDAARASYAARLMPEATAIAKRILGMELDWSYRSGWPRDLTFADALERNWAQDQEAGSTGVGPQRAELVLRLDGSPVRDRISRGQQKLLAASLVIAQLRLFPLDPSFRPTLLLDDPAAELDSARLGALIGEISGCSVQLIVTALDPHFRALGAPGRRYVVAAGVVAEV